MLRSSLFLVNELDSVTAKLRNSDKIDKSFSINICKNFPQLANELFSHPNAALPNCDEIVDLIESHPPLFNLLAKNPRFAKLINDTFTLSALALLSEEISLFVFNNEHKFDQLDKSSFIGSAQPYEKIALKVVEDATFEPYLNNKNLWALGSTHIEVAKIITKDLKLSCMLTRAQLQKLQDKINEHGCTPSMGM